MPGHFRRLIISTIMMCPLVGLAQESATVRIPDVVKAGETVDLEIILDKAPNFDGGAIQIWITGPNNFYVQSSCALKLGAKSCDFPFKVPPDAAGGTWFVSKLAFWTGTRQIDLPYDKLPFKVIANSGLVFPTSAEVTINPSQIQLFRREATRLQLRLQTLKTSIAESVRHSSPITKSILSDNIKHEIELLDNTESQFHDLGEQQTQSKTAQVFFDDLRTSYKTVLDALGESGSAHAAPPTALNVAWNSKFIGYGDAHGGDNSLAAMAVFRVLEQNERAYELVADTGSLTFDLEVQSSPEGANVSYRRRGDPYHDNPKPTDSVIQALPYAIWIVRFQKPGYRDEEVEHDPFREPNHVLMVQLTKN